MTIIIISIIIQVNSQTIVYNDSVTNGNTNSAKNQITSEHILHNFQELEVKIKWLEQCVENLQERKANSDELVKRRRSISAELVDHDELKLSEELSKIWTTINNLIANSHEQFDKLKIELTSIAKGSKTSRSSSRDFDSSLNKTLSTYLEDMKDEMLSQFAEVI